MSLPKSVYNQLVHLKEFMKNQHPGNKPTISSVLKNWPYGFNSHSDVMYDFKNNDRRDYLSEWKRLKFASKINGRKDVLMDDKFIFHKMNEGNPHVLPVQFLILNKAIHRYTNGNLIPSTLSEFYAALKDSPHGFIIKPFIGGGGAGITKVIVENRKISFSGYCRTEDQFINLLKSRTSYLVTAIIQQSGYAHAIFSKSLNTIRILTMVDPATQTPFIAAAVHRFGTEKSGFLDNWTAGGLCFSIDTETGMLGKGASSPIDGKMNWYSSHPETGINVEGVSIPNWMTIKTELLKMAKRNFYTPYVGWDIVPMQDGFYVLEGNFNSGITILQVHGGLLKNQSVRKFYKKYKVL